MLTKLVFIYVDSTPAVEKTMTDFCIANEVDPKYFFAHSHVRIPLVNTSIYFNTLTIFDINLNL